MQTITTKSGLVLPAHTHRSINLYVECGIYPGDFLLSVLRNDLSSVIGYGDDESINHLKDTVRYLCNNCPADCWGSNDKVDQWMLKKRQNAS